MPASLENPVLPYSDQQKADVQQQLGRMLENSHFSHSKRFPSFLRFIIQEELEGRGEQLKERTLGLEVFGRGPGYDTTSDPIVRVTAAEIRKRIAQYYQEQGHASELRISLPPGSYVPHFSWPRDPLEAPSPVLPVPSEPDGELALVLPAVPVRLSEAQDIRSSARLRLQRFAWIAACVLIAMAVGGWAWMRSRPSQLNLFWAPVFATGDSVVLCLPRSELDTLELRDAAQPEQTHSFHERANAVILDDLQPLVNIAGLLGMRHQPSR